VVPLRTGEQVVGVLSLGISESERRYGDDDLAVAAELAHRGAMALENARLFQAASAARREADALQAVTAALSRAATVEDVADAVVRHGLPALGASAGGVVRLSDDGRELLMVAVSGFQAEHLRPFARFSVDRRLPTADVARTRRPAFVRSLEEWSARYDAPIPGPPFQAAAVLPLQIGDRLLGMLTLRFLEAREFDAAERARMETLATQCAQALDRARLFESEARARRRAEDEATRVRHLQSLTTELARAATPADVAQVALERARVAFAAAGGLVTIVTEDGREFIQLGTAGFGPGDVSRWRRYPVDAGTPGGEVLRTGMPAIITSYAEGEARFPVLAPVLRASGFPSFVSLPLRVDARMIGLVAFLFAEERGFPDDEMALMTAFAGQCAQAMERARAYEAERDARAQAEEARLRAEEANAAKMQFLTTMSHELRTPLNAIAGYAELLEMEVHGPLTAGQHEALRRIQRSERHLLSLINDVLNFARLDAGHLELQAREVEAAELLGGLEALVEPQLRARGQSFRCEPAAAELRAVADVEKVQQVLLNLLSNAIKFTPQGGEITLAADGADGAVRIHVRDTGMGIAPDKLERVFEPFVQLDRSLTSSHQGTGLGLAISRDLARAMGGDLTARSAPGTGSVFTLTLPAAES
jgi:signal transduction histidine kinase